MARRPELHPTPDMMTSPRTAALLAAATLIPAALAQITSPRQEFGHDIGADYVLPNYAQLSAYWRKLDRESDRMQLVSIGKTEEGRDQLMAIVSSPENLRRLGRYREISRRLALAESLTDREARELALEGRAIVWIDGGLHATEVLGAQQLMETVYQFVSMDDAETRRILDSVIILFVHANPDGMDLVSDWYMRNPDPLQRSLANVPRLYQKYIGHDNNRDFYASTQKETENMNRVMYREWFPQIMYNHHQTGPAGTVMFAPPFRDPFNHHIDPLTITGLDFVGTAMHQRFASEGKPGLTQRTGASYSTWWNGGLRTTAYFHNIIGILTETIGSPNPMRIPLVPDRLVPKGINPYPIESQEWKFRQSVEYSVTANRAILDLAARYRERFLFDVYQAGRNQIARARRDSWTDYPSRVEAAKVARPPSMQYLRKPEFRDARAYVLPSDQRDFATAVKFAYALLETGVAVDRVRKDFSVGDKTYPKGSLVVRCDQAFRPHILDMFEPQDHPNDVPAPGAAPTPPYDNAGYTLAFQMGVKFDRVLEPMDADLEAIHPGWTPEGAFSGGPPAGGFSASAAVNDSFLAANRLLEAGHAVYRAKPGTKAGSGDFFFADAPGVRAILERLVKENGLHFRSAGGNPELHSHQVKRPRVGLWDRYGGSMPSGWTRWILEQFEFPYRVVYAPELDGGGLREKYDVLVFVDGAIPGRAVQAGGAGVPVGTGDQTLMGEVAQRGGQELQDMPADIPPQFRPMWGRVTAGATVPKLSEFLEAGGTIITIGSSTNLAYHLGLPVKSALLDESGRSLPSTKYYIPGSVLRARADNSLPAAWGMEDSVDVFFDNSPVFQFEAGAELKGLKRILWFDSASPLRSGWAWGQERLKDGIAAFQAPVGKGMLYAFGPEVLFRAQPHGTFKLVFNAILQSGSRLP